MSDPDTEIEKLKKLSPGAELHTEGGQKIAFLPSLQITTRSGVETRDVVLWPAPRDSYQSRLFLSAAVTAPEAKNWNPFSMLGRTWYACSWQGVPHTLSWIEMLGAHLRAFR